MLDNISNNKRIAKNTTLLYFRMFLMMVISLFTSRVILNTLGVEDYGIYNVAGTVVTMFSALSSSFSSSISRFLTFELGRDNPKKLNLIFCTAINVQLMISLFLLVVAELVGVWFLNYKMNIPDGRLDAANFVFQCSLISFCVNLLSVPYNASIVAHEKMSAFAWISIVEVILKLVIVYILWITPFDKLKFYAFLMLCISILLRLIYGVYCKRSFLECSYRLIWDKSLLKKMTGFAGWTFGGNLCYIFNTQGVDMLINIFFGVTLNASRGIAKQVEGVINQFVNSFMTALNPQITKSYASRNLIYMHQLICVGAKYSYYLMLFFVVPICLETKAILNMWLGFIPAYAVDFVRLTCATSMITTLGNTLYIANLATGKIKKYQITVSILGLLCFPFTWFAFHWGFSPTTAYIIYFVVYFILLFVKIKLVNEQIHLRIFDFVKNVIVPVSVVSIISFIVPRFVVYSQTDTFFRLTQVTIFSAMCIIIAVYFWGTSSNEKRVIKQLTVVLINMIKNKVHM